MANSIALAQKYLPLLDEVYKAEGKSNILEAREGTDFNFTGANTIELFELSMQGMGDYDRQNGFLGGDVTGIWTPYTLTQDRGRSFTIDSQTNEETLGLAFGKLAGEFLRTQVVPEVDAYTFAKIAGTADISHGTHDQLSDITHPADEIDAAIAQFNEDEVPDEGRVVFMSEKFYEKFKKDTTRTINNFDTKINKTIEVYDGVQIIRVPQKRFLSAITLKTGKSGQEEGGYVGAATNYNLHFIMMDPEAVKKVTKHAVLRIFDPQTNQQADGWKVDYRVYYDAFVQNAKLKGVYFLRSDVANA